MVATTGVVVELALSVVWAVVAVVAADVDVETTGVMVVVSAVVVVACCEVAVVAAVEVIAADVVVSRTRHRDECLVYKTVLDKVEAGQSYERRLLRAKSVCVEFVTELSTQPLK